MIYIPYRKNRNKNSKKFSYLREKVIPLWGETTLKIKCYDKKATTP
jgi:hypothetical protein